MIANSRRRVVRIAEIVAEEFPELYVERILGKHRCWPDPMTLVRHAFWWALYESTELTLSRIGRELGFNHASISSGIQATIRRRRESADFMVRTDKALEKAMQLPRVLPLNEGDKGSE